MVTPHRSGREDICTLCLHDDCDIEDPPEISALETIFAHDKTIISLLKDPRDPEKLGPSLPIALAAVAHRLYAHKHGKRELKPAYLAGGKTVLYRLAMAFTLAKIRITTNPIDRDHFADDRRRKLQIDTLLKFIHPPRHYSLMHYSRIIALTRHPGCINELLQL